MSLPEGDPRLLRGDVARRLLASTVPARVAYTALDDTVVDFRTRIPGPLGGVLPEAG